MIVWTCLLTLAGCGKKDMDYTMQNESSVAESVRETGEESVLIQNEDAGARAQFLWFERWWETGR